MPGVVTRHLTEADGELLRVATLGNVNWGEERFTMRDVLERPDFAHYTRLDRSRGDFGYVAERDGRALAAVWALFLTSDDPGYGFLHNDIPELSLWVEGSERRRGLGRDLLGLLQDEARGRGIRALSLSVEAGNFARQLYEDEGFGAVPGRERDGVMVWSSSGGA